MIQVRTFSAFDKPKDKEKSAIISFLYTHLEQYGDKKEDIQKAFDYVTNGHSYGGFIVTASEGGKLLGASVVNKTGMTGYIPENILVYIATHNEHRGKGVASALMNTIIEKADGNIALHVEHDNPAKALYEKFGFTNKYLEMRLDKAILKTGKKEKSNGLCYA